MRGKKKARFFSIWDFGSEGAILKNLDAIIEKTLKRCQRWENRTIFSIFAKYLRRFMNFSSSRLHIRYYSILMFLISDPVIKSTVDRTKLNPVCQKHDLI